MDERLRRREELDARVQAGWAASTRADVLARLDAAEVPCSRGQQRARLFADPHVRARENLSRSRARSAAGCGCRASCRSSRATPGASRARGRPRVGAHNEEIYCGRLGLSRDDLAALARKGVV